MSLKNKFTAWIPDQVRDDDLKNELRHSLEGRDPGSNPAFKNHVDDLDPGLRRDDDGIGLLWCYHWEPE